MISFHKYQGAGNDFVIIDNRNGEIFLSSGQIRRLCDRKFGVGADGLMLLERSERADFAMSFFNPDGSSGMMCGNGGRCMVAFAKAVGACGEDCIFEAPDGIHRAKIQKGKVELQMCDVQKPLFYEDGVHLDTGTSHFVRFVEDLNAVDIENDGRKLRYDERFAAFNGCNVNFVKIESRNSISIRTYERGVEAETLACGTGVTAAALVAALKQGFEDGKHHMEVSARGGELSVGFKKCGESFFEITLTGGAEFVFSGRIEE